MEENGSVILPTNAGGNRCRREKPYVANQRNSATPVDRIVRHHFEVTIVVGQCDRILRVQD